jgi:hypothetical protein
MLRMDRARAHHFFTFVILEGEKDERLANAALEDLGISNICVIQC